MEVKNVQNRLECEDKFSKLPDDVLLYILGKANIPTCIKASVLSTRWRHLPSLLPYIDINISDSMGPCINQIAIDEAAVGITKALRMCLATAGREYHDDSNPPFVPDYQVLYEIGKLVCDAIDSGEVESLELALLTEKFSLKCAGDDMMWHARNLLGFFYASPSLVRSLTKLFLCNSRFDEQGIYRLLNTCEQLQHLFLHNCDTGDRSVLKIDMPNSKLSYLRLRSCLFEKIELKVGTLNAPCSFGFVPCLEELRLVCPAARYQSGLRSSEVLNGKTEIKVWMLPEGKKLYAFIQQLKMFIHGIFIKFGLLWTISLLQAAPSLKTFCIKVWHHACYAYRERAKKTFSKRTNPWQEDNKLNSSRHSQLTRLEFGGFIRTRKHVDFIRAMMAYAPDLQTVLLEDKAPCECSDAFNNNLSRSSLFSKNKYEQDAILNQLGVGVSCSMQIIFT